MHFLALVVIPPPDPEYDDGDPIDIEAAVEELMAPYTEGQRYREGWWDWYQIGGRWTGWLDGYDPDADPKNQEVCGICRGTGMRNDALGLDARAKDPSYTCNGCQGKGSHVSWPTQWGLHPGDVARWGDAKDVVMTKPHTPHRVVTHRETYAVEHWDETQRDNGNHGFIKHPEDVSRALANIPDDATVVIVDYHS